MFCELGSWTQIGFGSLGGRQDEQASPTSVSMEAIKLAGLCWHELGPYATGCSRATRGCSISFLISGMLAAGDMACSAGAAFGACDLSPEIHNQAFMLGLREPNTCPAPRLLGRSGSIVDHLSSSLAAAMRWPPCQRGCLHLPPHPQAVGPPDQHGEVIKLAGGKIQVAGL